MKEAGCDIVRGLGGLGKDAGGLDKMNLGPDDQDVPFCGQRSRLLLVSSSGSGKGFVLWSRL